MIATLRREAAASGDQDQVTSCDAALRDDFHSTFSRAQCAETITAARAMDDSTPFVRVVA